MWRWTDLVLAVDNARAPARNAAGPEVTKAAAETVAPVTLAVGIEREVLDVAIAPRSRHLGDSLRLLVVSTVLLDRKSALRGIERGSERASMTDLGHDSERRKLCGGWSGEGLSNGRLVVVVCLL